MYARKRRIEEIPHAVTAVWSCVKEGCNGWMRDDFSFAAEPACGLCGSSMKKSMKTVTLVVNTNSRQKILESDNQIEHE